MKPKESSTIRIAMEAKEPSLRITRWLQTPASRFDIPLEAECTACSDARFKIDDVRRKELEPTHAGYLKFLEVQFDQHLRLVHPTAQRRLGDPKPDWIAELKVGRTQQALDMLRKERPSPSNHYSLGAAYMWAGDYQAALVHFDERIRNHRPGTPPGDLDYGMAGAAAWCLGQETLALKHWQKGTKAKRGIAGANTRTLLLLYAVSILKPDVFSTVDAEELLAKKLAHRWITGWPDPIAELIVGLTTEAQAWEKALDRANSANCNWKSWQLELYKMLKSASSDGGRNPAFQQELARHIAVEHSGYLQGKNFFYFLRNEGFYLARHHCHADPPSSY
jgi:hypothetical protein